MAGAITRKIDLAQQISEQRLTIDEPAPAGTRRGQEERLERRRAILKTLEFNQQHEHLIRAFMADRKGEAGGIRLRVMHGQLCWSNAFAPNDWQPLDEGAANVMLARFDPPGEGT